jgi:hypothetical protein
MEPSKLIKIERLMSGYAFGVIPPIFEPLNYAE